MVYLGGKSVNIVNGKSQFRIERKTERRGRLLKLCIELWCIWRSIWTGSRKAETGLIPVYVLKERLVFIFFNLPGENSIRIRDVSLNSKLDAEIYDSAVIILRESKWVLSKSARRGPGRLPLFLLPFPERSAGNSRDSQPPPPPTHVEFSIRNWIDSRSPNPTLKTGEFFNSPPVVIDSKILGASDVY